MNPSRRRQYVLAGVLLVSLLLAAVVLSEVLGTVFFAVTVAYVLVPPRNRLAERGLSRRAASAVVTSSAFAVVLLVSGAFGYLIYQRGRTALELLLALPDTFVFAVAGMTYTVELREVLVTSVGVAQGVAAGIAVVLPVVLLKGLLFAVLVFGLLLHPGAAARAAARLVPPEYHDVVRALNDRVKNTLYGIYVLQAATAFGTALVALVVFALLGYRGVVTLAIVAGVLQFIPVLGPSVLLVVLAAVDVAAGNLTRAALVLVIGGVLVGAVPDAVIRPRLASWAADLPTSLYFIGFVGGVLTVGPIGFIAGPLAVALVVELVDLLSDGPVHQTTLDAPVVGEDEGGFEGSK
ncbi:AI-2E family transporter [Halomarina litorea]|uniref:AI-2E family transporter n=1 Tax=Halomarina litorea TaxID=2961595 RepID=UPI0020C45815|nr:AI-2E family transporter [Halomarina sp. BCD28]